MASVTVQISNALIEKGRRGNCVMCPIALGIGRLLGSGYYAAVDRGWFEIWKNTPEGSAAPAQSDILPVEARDFIERFDTGHRVDPFAFKVDIDSEYLESSHAR